ncbi:MAG: HAD-IA family hydrolase [Roseburia sp.]|nr:HAD-IA family hydrolase [Roseburia sp.]
MREISTILFDMYGVIIEESKGRFLPYTYMHFEAAEHDRIKRLFREEQLFTRAGNGELSSDAFLSLLGYENPQYHMKDYLDNYLTLDSGFIPFAEAYYQRLDFVLLSNDVSEWSAHITAHHGLNKYFKDKIVSGDVKCRKPDKRIFELTLERIGRAASECVFIDNSVINLEAAEALGVRPILFNRDGVEYAGRAVNSFAELTSLLCAGCV